MKLTFSVCGTDYTFKPYKMKKVKEAIFNIGQSTDTSTNKKIEILFNTLIGTDNSFDIYDKLYILLKMKSKIDDNQNNIRYTCSNCKQISEGILLISESLKLSDYDKLIKINDDLKLQIPYADKLENSVPIEILDELDILDYVLVEKLFEFSKPRLTFTSDCNCMLCSSVNTFTFSIEELVEQVLPIDFMNLYKYEAYMKVRGFSLPEIMNMYPYEMELYKNTVDQLTQQE